MKQLFQDNGGIPVHFVRFNPDKYKTKGLQKSLEQRLTFLCNHIDTIVNNKNFFIKYPNLTVTYLFYDNWDNKIEVNEIIF